jgi:DNA-binding MarR family transcriptional regulator
MSSVLTSKYLLLQYAAMDSVDKLLSQWRSERPDLDVSALGIAIRIEMLAKLMHRETAESLDAVGLKPWEYDVLSALRRQGKPYALPARELARASLLTAGAMTTRIDHLEIQRLVERAPDPDDRRGVRVTLTPRGLALIDDAIEARLTAAESAIACMTGKQRAAAAGALRTLLESIESQTLYLRRRNKREGSR